MYGSIIGAGGGFVMVAGLVIVFDLSGATAVGTSVVTTAAIQAPAPTRIRSKGLVDRPSRLWFVVGSMPVALLSAIFLADRIPENTFELIIGVLHARARRVRGVRASSRSSRRYDASAPCVRRSIGSGSVIGMLSGGFGVGAGLVTVPLLGRLQRLSAHRAAATTTLVGTLSGLAASLGHAIADNPKWSAVPFTIVGAGSARLGPPTPAA